jgi:hypothetical protein
MLGDWVCTAVLVVSQAFEESNPLLAATTITLLNPSPRSGFSAKEYQMGGDDVEGSRAIFVFCEVHAHVFVLRPIM